MECHLNIENGLKDTDIVVVEKIEHLGLKDALKIKDMGVYIWWTPEKRAYIGRSKNTGNRIFQHAYQRWYKKYRPTIEFVNIYVTENIQQADALEKIMIDRLQPEINSPISKKNLYNYEYFYRKKILEKWRLDEFEKLRTKYKNINGEEDNWFKELNYLKKLYIRKLKALKIYDKDTLNDIKWEVIRYAEYIYD